MADAREDRLSTIYCACFSTALHNSAVMPLGSKSEVLQWAPRYDSRAVRLHCNLSRHCCVPRGHGVLSPLR